MDGAVKSSWETQKNTQNQSSIEPEPGFWVFHILNFVLLILQAAILFQHSPRSR